MAFSGSLYPGDRGGPGITKRTATCTQHTRIMVVEDELSGIQRELSMFPERAFDFQHAGTIVIEQVPPLQHVCDTYIHTHICTYTCAAVAVRVWLGLDQLLYCPRFVRNAFARGNVAQNVLG